MEYLALEHLEDIDQAKGFLAAMINYVGGVFHPDNSAADYYDQRSGEDLFDAANVERIDNLIVEAFDLFDIAEQDIYEHCLSLI
jgi:hypothetical protein